MFESKNEPLASRRQFLGRLAASFVISMLILGVSLLVGMLGYWLLEDASWTDSFLNGALLLSGIGTVIEPKTHGGKIFAGFYALYAGLVFVAACGILLAPIVHRLLHHFHLGGDDKKG